MRHHHVNAALPERASITFAVDVACRLRIATFRGAIFDAELLDAYHPLLTDVRFDPALDDLVDLRAVSHMGVTSAGLHRIIALYDEREPANLPTRSALVAPTDVLYGVSRMFQTLRGDGHAAEVEVFRTLEAANRWLERMEQAPGS